MPTAMLRDPHRNQPVPPHRRHGRPGGHLAGGLAVVLATGWFGLKVVPGPLPQPSVAAGAVTTAPLPDGLPAPVDRFYRRLYGDRVPIVDSAVITGRGTMRIAGIVFPARFRFNHVTGEAYRHYIELTVFGTRLVAVDEWFVDGRARLELPFGSVKDHRSIRAPTSRCGRRPSGCPPSGSPTYGLTGNRWTPPPPD